MKKIESFFKWFGSYLAIAGLVTFSMFIMEEAFQTTMFGTWPAQDAGEWRLVVRGVDTMEGINTTLKWTNRLGGWIQPFAFLAYGAYARSADFYIEALRAKAFANCPECFDGREITFTFRPQEIEDGTGRSGRVVVPNCTSERTVHGKVQVTERDITIIETVHESGIQDRR